MARESSLVEELIAGSRALGVPLSDEQARQFARYAEMLEEWNRVVNLTRVPPEEVVPLHFLDSLTLARAVDMSRQLRLVDVGTGAGFPGLALKIAFPALDVTLMDSTRKRLDFLDAVIADLALTGVRTLHCRAENAGRDPAHRQKYDLAAARAVSRLDVLAELLLPLVRVGGAAAALKSATVDDEIGEAEPAVQALGGAPAEVHALILPGTDIQRKLVIMDKVRPTPPQYPRDSSQIKSRPLRTRR